MIVEVILSIWRSAGIAGLAMLIGATLSFEKDAHAAPTNAEARILAEAGFDAGDVGYIVYDPVSGAIEREWQADRGFIPASVTKVLTAVEALEALGPEHRFRTWLSAGGPVAGDDVVRHLTLVGEGDPLLVSDDIDRLARGLADLPFKMDVARFDYDDTMLPFIQEIDPQQHEAAAYNAPVSALSVDFNRQLLHWKRRGAVLDAAIQPDFDIADANVARNRLTGGVDAALSWSTTGRPVWWVAPNVPDSGATWVPVRRPALRAAMMLRAVAAEEDIELPLPTPGRISHEDVPLVVHQSEPVREIVASMLKFSNNVVAEALGLQVSRFLGMSDLTLAESSRASFSWLRSALPRVDWGGFVRMNHSGLSAATRSSPRQYLAILAYGAARDYGGFSLVDLMDRPGWQLPGEPDFVRAKSGTMYYASGLAGELDTSSGRSLLFVLFVGDLEARQRHDGAEDRFGRRAREAARSWTRAAKTLEESLVTHWARML